PHSLALLRARRERPCERRTAEQRDEPAAPHSITSSAMASNPGGKVIPSDLAVFRLISSSNLADWDHRQFSRSRAVQNFAAVDAGLAIGVCQIRRIAHQAASSDELALAIDGRQCIACREPDDLVGPDPKERAGADHHCTGAKLLRLVESSVDLSF